MNWLLWVPIIAQHGLPFAEKLWRLAESGAAPTEKDWQELDALGAQTATSQMAAAMVRAGIDPNNEHAKAVLALTKP